MSWRDSSLNSGTCLSSSSLWSIGAISPSRMVMTAVGPRSIPRPLRGIETGLTPTLERARSARSRGRRPMPESPTPAPGSDPAKRHSAALTDGPDRAGARAMLKAIGFTDDDLAKPLVGVATTWIETMPCNYNQRRLADCVKDGIRAAGGTPMEFNTISVSDGVSMGSEGMKASLVSREVIADSIEL